MKKKNKYISYIIDEMAGNISAEHQKKLYSWLAADEKNKAEYDLISKIISEGQKMEFPNGPNVQTAWDQFEFPADPLPKQNNSFQGWRITAEWIASILQPRRLAYIALFIVITGLFTIWYKQSAYGVKVITTVNSQKKEISLSDGTTVYLNSGTELTYPKTFSDTARTLSLSGEAYFNVTKSESPFIVQTSEGSITVLGTRFNIWARNTQTRVIVEEGLVRLAANNNARNIILTEDLMSEIYQNRPPSKPYIIDAKEMLGWRSGKLVFRRTKLSEIVGEIGRYYNINIFIENPELQRRTITAVFDRLPLNDVLYSVCSTLDIQYRYEKGKYILYNEHVP